MRFVGATLSAEPLGVLELGDSEMEDESELAAEAGGATDAFLHVFVVAASGVEAGAQPGGVPV